VKEYEAVAEYNNTLARFEWCKGTILPHDNVAIAEGALPVCAQVRAVEHERERTHSLVLHERPDAIHHPGRLACNTEGLPATLDPHAPPPPLPADQIGAPAVDRGPIGEPAADKKTATAMDKKATAAVDKKT